MTTLANVRPPSRGRVADPVDPADAAVALHVRLRRYRVRLAGLAVGYPAAFLAAHELVQVNRRDLDAADAGDDLAVIVEVALQAARLAGDQIGEAVRPTWLSATIARVAADRLQEQFVGRSNLPTLETILRWAVRSLRVEIFGEQRSPAEQVVDLVVKIRRLVDDLKAVDAAFGEARRATAQAQRLLLAAGEGRGR